jgi:hypothetical protein
MEGVPYPCYVRISQSLAQMFPIINSRYENHCIAMIVLRWNWSHCIYANRGLPVPPPDLSLLLLMTLQASRSEIITSPRA